MIAPQPAPPPATQLASVPENIVVALACNGDESAFAELVRRRHAQIRTLFRRLSGNPALADDLAQECFLQAWRQLGQLKSVGAFGGWLRQIALNGWLQHLRGRQRMRNQQPTSVDQDSCTHAAAEHIDLVAALSVLEPLPRTCVVMFYHEGMTHEQISRSMGLPLGTVKSHIARSTARLRELLAAYAPSTAKEKS